MHVRLIFYIAVGIALTAAQQVRAQGADELWEVKTTMIMEGMRMPGPPTKVCTKGTQANLMTPVEKDCKMSDVRTVGNRTTYRVTCTGKEPMSGTGEITRGQGNYRGVLELNSTVGGEKTTIVNEYSGRLVGKCTAK